MLNALRKLKNSPEQGYDRQPHRKGTVDGSIHTGTTGGRDPLTNSVMYWAWGGSTDWTVRLHCTSDPDKAAFDTPKDS